jgi:hypothetical protein
LPVFTLFAAHRLPRLRWLLGFGVLLMPALLLALPMLLLRSLAGSLRPIPALLPVALLLPAVAVAAAAMV